MLARRAIDIANEVQMKRSLNPGPSILVEGRADKLFFSQFLSSSAEVTLCDGKKNVLDAHGILRDLEFPGVVGIVDADFDHLRGINNANDDLFVTDVHDVETLMVLGASLDRVVGEFGSENKIADAVLSPRELVLESAKYLGALRLISLTQGLNLSFTNIDYGRFLDRGSGAIDIDQMLVEVANKSQRHDLDRATLSASIQDFNYGSTDVRQLVCGEDLVGILSVLLRYVLGRNNASEVTAARLRSALRLAFGAEDFWRCQLGIQLAYWNANNDAFPIVPD